MNSDCSFIDVLRGPKIFNIALFDLTGTIIIAIILTLVVLKVKNYDFSSNIAYVILYCFLVSFTALIIGSVVHYIFGIPTMLNYYLGLNSYNDVMSARKIC
jgi:hypothetical protein